jgi:hypothetical protein
MSQRLHLNDLYIVATALLYRMEHGLSPDHNSDLQYVINELETLPDLDVIERGNLTIARSELYLRRPRASGERICKIISRRLFVRV